MIQMINDIWKIITNKSKTQEPYTIQQLLIGNFEQFLEHNTPKVKIVG